MLSDTSKGSFLKTLTFCAIDLPTSAKRFTFKQNGIDDEFIPIQLPRLMSDQRVVVVCESTKSKKKVVFKVLKFSHDDEIIDGETKQDVINMINNTSNVNLLTVQVFPQDNNEFIILSDYKGKDLGLVRANIIKGKKQIPVLIVLQILVQTLSALEKLHQKGLVHRDVKLQNIFMDGMFVVLGDFGTVTNINESDNEYSICSTAGSHEYRPPEYETDNISFKWDVWSLGITILKFMFGDQNVKPGLSCLKTYTKNSEEIFIQNLKEMMDNLFKTEMQNLEIDSCSWKDIKLILEEMLQTESKRISISDLKSKYFGGKLILNNQITISWQSNLNVAEYIGRVNGKKQQSHCFSTSATVNSVILPPVGLSAPVGIFSTPVVRVISFLFSLFTGG